VKPIEQSSQFDLLRQRRFLPFFMTQFLGAFNDNLFKNALIILITFNLASSLEIHVLVNISAGLFILPFFVFSATAGQLADKFDKAVLMRHVKTAEIIVMLLGAVGLYFKNVPLLLSVLFLMGTQSTFFGPSKYGILPQHLNEQELIGGNGLVETGTFLAILLGTLFGGLLVGLSDVGRHVASVVIVIVAVIGRWCSHFIPTAPPPDPELNFNFNIGVETARIVKFTVRNHTVFLSILGISWFWFFGSVFLTQFPSYTKLTLVGDGTVATLLLTFFSIGIGAGSLLCEKLSARHIEPGLVPLGAFGMTVFAVDLAFAHTTSTGTQLLNAQMFLANAANWRVLMDLGLISLFSGFYIVPLYAIVQHRSEPRHRSRIIAGNNIINAAFMVIAALMSIGLLKAGLTIPQLFLVVALMNAAVAVFIFTEVPEFMMRMIMWLLVHSIYRVERQDLHHIPLAGPALLVSNHVSFVDALIISAASPRPIRFVMDHQIFNLPVLNFVFRTAQAIPIAPGQRDSSILESAYDSIAEALRRGELVCIFPEGEITKTGDINSFKKGVEHIVRRTPVNVVPLALRGVWGTFFSRKGGRAMSGWPTRLWSKIVIAGGAPLAPEAVSATQLQDIVTDLRGSRR
jgi:1-acyl-sn-glycerol-3-phosphate acyltransferase